MTNKTIYFYTGSGAKPLEDDLNDVFDLFELNKEVRSLSIFKKIFKYKKGVILSYREDVTPASFYLAIILRYICRGQIKIKYENNSEEKITFVKLVQYFFRFIRDIVTKKKYINTLTANIIDKLSQENKKYKLDLSKTPAYIRACQSYGLKSGGSIGHIGGVLNNLEKFTHKKPIFLTNDIIPEIDVSIESNIVFLQNNFEHSTEERYFKYTDKLTKEGFELLKDKEISFIYQRYALFNYSGVELKDMLKVPLVLEYNGSEVWAHRNWGNALKNEKLAINVENLNLQKADLVVVVSEPLKDEIIERGVEENRIIVNFNGVNTEKYSPKINGSEIRKKYNLDGKIVFGFIGTFGKWHGAEVLAEAFGRLFEKKPLLREKFRLLMIGDGMTMTEVQANIEKYKINKEVILTGTVPQKDGPAHLAACDVFMSPHVPNPDGTKFFGSPTKLFEYMAMGKAIIASNLEQIGDILTHNETAYMVTPGDADELVKAMEVLTEDSELRVKLGKKAREIVVEKYTWYKHTERIIGKLRELCE